MEGSVRLRKGNYRFGIDPLECRLLLASTPASLVAVNAAAFSVNVFDSADAYVNDGAPSLTVPTGPLNVNTAGSVGYGGNDKAYVRFDLSSVPAGTLSSAALTLSGSVSSGSATFDVYGLNDGTAGDAPAPPIANGWSETGITWDNAPANNLNSANGFTSDATEIGSFTITGTQTVSFSSPQLLTFLSADTNRQVTFMLSREQNSWTIDSTFASRESTSGQPELSLVGTPIAATPPVNSVLPTISGTAKVGNTLSATSGTWSNSPSSYSYQWNRHGSAIPNATNSTYALVYADNGATITVSVTAINSSGFSRATSSATTVATMAVKSIQNWLGGVIDGSQDEEAAVAAAFAAAANNAFVLQVDCPVFIHVGADIARPIFVEQWNHGELHRQRQVHPR